MIQRVNKHRPSLNGRYQALPPINIGRKSPKTIEKTEQQVIDEGGDEPIKVTDHEPTNSEGFVT